MKSRTHFLKQNVATEEEFKKDKDTNAATKNASMDTALSSATVMSRKLFMKLFVKFLLPNLFT